MSVTRITEMEKALTSICADVNKLMDVVGQHGDHLREIFSAVPTFASKTELMAAMASIRQKNSAITSMALASSTAQDGDMNTRIANIEKGIKVVSQSIRQSARSNKHREDMLEDNQKTITMLRQSNRKLEMRLQAAEDEMKYMRDRIESIDSRQVQVGSPSSTVPFPPRLALSSLNSCAVVQQALPLVGTGGSSMQGSTIEDEGERESVVSMPDGGGGVLSSGPSVELDHILSVPGPETEGEREKARDREAAITGAIEKASVLEALLNESINQSAVRQAQDDEFRRKISLEIQTLTERSASLATSSLSGEGVESLISAAAGVQVEKAVKAAKRSLTAVLRESTNIAILASERRLEVALTQKLQSALLDIDLLRDNLMENNEGLRQANTRLKGVEELLVLLDAEHSSIVSTMRVHEVERTATDHYCYSAIDLLTATLDRQLHNNDWHSKNNSSSKNIKNAPPLTATQAVHAPHRKGRR
jgi:hypothetical protein